MTSNDRGRLRSRRLSVVAGFAGAIVISLVGPFYGGLVLILGIPLIFLTLSRAVIGVTTEPAWSWVLVTFGIAWFLLLPVSPLIQNQRPLSDRDWEVVLAIGLIPILLGIGLVGVSRLRGRAP